MHEHRYKKCDGSSPEDLSETCLGNPIRPATGEKTQTEQDWNDGGVHPLHWVRHFRSYGVPAAGLGENWSHPYASRLVVSGAEAIVRLSDGGVALFRPDAASGTWRSDSGLDQLVGTAQGWLFTDVKNERQMLFQTGTGLLLSITERNGWQLSLAYAAGRLARVTNAFGRRLVLAYDTQGRLSLVTLPDGNQIRYGFSGTGQLDSAVYPDGSFRRYVYEDTRWPNALTGIFDEAGVRYATFAYDAAGRAVQTLYVGGVNSFTLSYATSGTNARLSVDANIAAPVETV